VAHWEGMCTPSAEEEEGEGGEDELRHPSHRHELERADPACERNLETSSLDCEQNATQSNEKKRCSLANAVVIGAGVRAAVASRCR